MNKKIPLKKPLAIALVLCICCFSFTAVYAFLISKDAVSNPFTAGENTSHIEESFGSYEKFEKGKSYEKDVAVKNDGSVTCYVRVFAEIEDPDAAENITIDFNKTDWTEKQADGYYYYKKSLKPGEKTTSLFTTLKAKETIDEFKMICYSETVQAYGYSSAVKAFADI